MSCNWNTGIIVSVIKSKNSGHWTQFSNIVSPIYSLLVMLTMNAADSTVILLLLDYLCPLWSVAVEAQKAWFCSFGKYIDRRIIAFAVWHETYINMARGYFDLLKFLFCHSKKDVDGILMEYSEYSNAIWASSSSQLLYFKRPNFIRTTCFMSGVLWTWPTKL